MHQLIETAHEFYDLFCKQTLSIYKQAMHKSISSVGANDTDVIVQVSFLIVLELFYAYFQGFQYLNCVCKYSEKFYNEKIETGLQEWITCLLQLIEITEPKESFDVIEGLKKVSTNLLSKRNLSSHFENEVRSLTISYSIVLCEYCLGAVESKRKSK